MLIVVVPLAGPDYFQNGDTKGLKPFNGQPYLKYILDSRPWRNTVSKYYFVLHDEPLARDFYFNFIKSWYPRSEAIFIPEYLPGAAYSVYHALTSLDEDRSSLIVDLADIYFMTSSYSVDIQLTPKSVDSVAYAFKSTSSNYSYFVTDSSGRILDATEKSVVSNNASTGVYYFKHKDVFISLFREARLNESRYLYNQLLYISPLLSASCVTNNTSIIELVDQESVVDPRL